MSKLAVRLLLLILLITFIGIGAYTTSLLWVYYHLTPWLGMVAGVALSIIVALAIGWLLFRFRLPLLTFAICTIAVAFIFEFIAISVPFAGGDEGMIISYAPFENTWLNLRFMDIRYNYFIILALVICIVVFCTNNCF